MGRTPLGIKVWESALSEEKGVRGGKLYKCYVCGKSFQRKHCELEHKIPVCDLRLSIDTMAWDYIYSRLNDTDGGGSNLGIICKECHKKLTAEQRREKTRLKKTNKYLICRKKMAGEMKVIEILDIKEVDVSKWEVIGVWDTEKEAVTNLNKVGV